MVVHQTTEVQIFTNLNSAFEITFLVFEIRSMDNMTINLVIAYATHANIQ